MSNGEPTSFLQAATGIDVISSDGDRVGTLAHVLADEQTSIFDGIVIDVSSGPERWSSSPWPATGFKMSRARAGTPPRLWGSPKRWAGRIWPQGR